MSLNVQVNMIQLSNDQGRFTAERVARTRPKTYRAIVRLLAEPDAKIEHIAQRHRVSTHTVRAIRAREAVAIAERKQRLMLIFANVAELSAERMEELAGQASLRDAGTTAGIATDKLLALSGDPAMIIQHGHAHVVEHHIKPMGLSDYLKEIREHEIRGDTISPSPSGSGMHLLPDSAPDKKN
jgi:transposase-like protein